MKQDYKFLLLGCIIITFIDVTCSIISRTINLNYALLSPISFIIYGLVSFFTTKKKELKTGILFASATGLFDSTVGWKISMLLNANTGNIKNNPTPFQWFITAIFVTGTAALAGWLGGGLAKRHQKRTKM